MNRILGLFMTAALAAGVISAQKADAVLNNYSLIDPALPNYGIAQGSLFIVKGSGLGPVQTPKLWDLSKGDLPISDSGTSVTVTVNGTTVTAPLYYVFDQQIAAVLPSTTPTGTGTVTVTFNNKSTTSPIKVVPAAFGIDTFTGNGTGTVVAQNYSNLAGNLPTLVTPTAAANPGDALVLWGTGLGPSPSGTNDAHFPMPQTDMKANVKVFIGGQQAAIAYAGRSQYPGVDQINVTVPQGVTGCSVGVVVQTGTIVSNLGSLPIASSGRTCSDASITGLSPTDLQNIFSKPSARIGFLDLTKDTSQTPAITFNGTVISPAKTTTSDSAIGIFEEFSTAQVAAAGAFAINQTSLGSCTAYQFKGNASSIPQIGTPKVLDAGTITLNLPDGSKKDLQKESGLYMLSGSDAGASSPALFIPAAGGQFSFTNTAGADVPVFSGAQITMPPALVWTNMNTIDNVNRSQDLTVTWDKANPYSGFVSISGLSFSVTGADTTNALVTGFTCTAPYSAGTFTIPSYILSMLVPSSTLAGIALPGSLSLSLNAQPVKFNAPTLDYAVVSASSSTGKSVTYQLFDSPGAVR